MKRRSLFEALACAVLVSSCKDDQRFFESAEFGIFYGGQIQEREQIPFVIDESRQQQGFRLVLARAASEPLRIRWELSRPGVVPRGKALPSPDDRVTELGEAFLPPGQTRFEKRFPFAAGDPLGLWNIRVTAGPHLAIDRPFVVYDAAARRRKRRAARTRDAGH